MLKKIILFFVLLFGIFGSNLLVVNADNQDIIAADKELYLDKKADAERSQETANNYSYQYDRGDGTLITYDQSQYDASISTMDTIKEANPTNYATLPTYIELESSTSTYESGKLGAQTIADLAHDSANAREDDYYQSMIDNGTLKQKADGEQSQANKLQTTANNLQADAVSECASGASAACTAAEAAADTAQAEADTAQAEADTAQDTYDEDPESEGDIASAGYKLSVGSISPGMVATGGNIKENTNIILANIIQILMVTLGSIALLIMTIGAGYMILHSGQEELLSKGKLIFTSGVYALVISLASYFIVDLFAYILYFFDMS